MESAANNNHANWEEIMMRRAANEDILEYPGSDKKFPSNFKLKSLLTQAIKRGQDIAASQEAPGTGKIQSMIIKKLEKQLLSMRVKVDKSFPTLIVTIIWVEREVQSELSVLLQQQGNFARTTEIVRKHDVPPMGCYLQTEVKLSFRNDPVT